jgi:hypothetical protein
MARRHRLPVPVWSPPDGVRANTGDIALIAASPCLDACHGAAAARRSIRLPVPLERGACAPAERATNHAPSTGTGVVTFLMG